MAKAPKPEGETQEAKQVEKLFPVVLTKHYAPLDTTPYEIVGHLRPKVERKNPAGQMVVVEPEKFIEGEMMPAPLPGTGYPNKIWAGTHIKLPVDEARRLVAAKLADRADDIAA